MEETANVKQEKVEKQISADTHGVETPPTSVSKEEVDKKTWEDIAQALDRIFFWLFLALVVSTSIAIYSYAGKLWSLGQRNFYQALTLNAAEFSPLCLLFLYRSHVWLV